jgi:hypothetical protein
MYIGNKKVKKIINKKTDTKNGYVIFEDGTEKFLPNASEYLTTVEPMDVVDGQSIETQIDYKTQIFMLRKFLEKIPELDLIKCYEGTNEEKDAHNVFVTVKLMEVVIKYDFPISRIPKVFHSLKSLMSGLDTFMMNNVKNYENKAVATALGLTDGDTDNEKLYNAKLSDYIKFLNT